MKKSSKYLLLFFGIFLFSIIFCFTFGDFIIQNVPIWHTVKNIPNKDDEIVSILSLTMIASGHRDALVVLTEEGDVYFLNRGFGNFAFEEWSKFDNFPKSENKIVNLKKFGNYPNLGIYIETSKGNYYAKEGVDFEYEKDFWQVINKEKFLSLPSNKGEHEDYKKFDQEEYSFYWKTLREPDGDIIDRASIYPTFAFSEEARNYILMKDGELKILSRTHGIANYAIYFLDGIFLGALINIITFLIIFRKSLLKFFKNILNKVKFRKN